MDPGKPYEQLKERGHEEMNFRKNESAQKLRGGYYTPPEIAAFLSRWVLQGGPRDLLEPSCGDGTFLDAVARLRPRGVRSFTGCEIIEEEAMKARARARSLSPTRLTVHTTDFLQWHLDQIDQPPSYDGVLGNPPFIRYQYLDSVLQERAQRIFEFHKLPFTKHTNAWVPFVIGSIAQLRPGGRLGMVVPAELLHVLHAQSLRQLLLRECSRVLIVDPQELWFDDLLQGVVLLLAERAPAGHRGGRVAVVPVKCKAFLGGDAQTLFEVAQFIPGSSLKRKWMPALLTEKERSLLAALREHEAVHEFQDIASVDVGIVTGANKFFLVPDSVVEKHGLSRWAHPMFGRSDHVRGVIFDQRAYAENARLDLPSNFLWFGDRAPHEFPKSVQKYIADGEKQGLHRRYKCRIRTPWYNVPSIFPTPVGMLKRSHDFPRLTLNRMGVLTTDTAYRVRPTKIAAARLVFCFVNSLTALSTELEGRHYGGGVLELVPSEIERVLIPVLPAPRAGLEQLDRNVRAGLAPRRLLAAQDEQILRPLGLSVRDCETLLTAWTRLRNRRQRNGHDDDDSGDLEDVGTALAGGTVDR
jgi:adenine-specific DNA-methyltransferase